MRRVASVAICVVLLASSFAIASPAFAQESPSKVDSDGDKIYNDLDAKIEGRADSALVDVIAVFTGQGSQEEIAEAKRAVGTFRVNYTYQTISAVAAELSVGQIKALARRAQTVQIQLDAPMTAHMDTARASSGVNAGRIGFGVDGNNQSAAGLCGGARSYCAEDVTVAIIDTGIHAAHADLDGGKVIGFANCLNTTTCSEVAPFDDNGHGTHVASMVAGDGDGSASRALAGVAPGAALVGVKVLGSSGSGSTSGVDAGVEWVIANKARFGIEILNMSLGSATTSAGTDSTSRVVNRAAAHGITPFVSAGNSGPGRTTIGSPGVAKFAITVGAMADPGDAEGTRVPGFGLASFSSRGPTVDARIKPDIAAPGVDISAAAAGTTSGYSIKSGTSMSSPFAAGVGALVLDANPALGSTGSACAPGNTTGECADGVVDSSMGTSLKGNLTASAVDWGPAGDDNEYGAGRLAPYAAIAAASSGTGTGDVQVPTHTFTQGSLAATGASVLHSLPVTSTEAPIAITFVMPNWSSTSDPDFDIYLLNPSGAQVAKSDGTARQETIGILPTITGDWTLRVVSYTGSGPYWFDASFPGAPIAPPELNTPPTASATSATTFEDTAVSVSLGGRDEENCELTFAIVTAPAHGTLGPITNTSCAAGDTNTDSAAVVYTPHPNFNGTDPFSYKVRDATSESSAAQVTVTITPVDDSLIGAPTGLTATGAKGKIALSWQAPTNPGETGIARYEIWRSSSAAGPFMKIVPSPTSTSYTDTGLSRRATYWYYVVAVDNATNRSEPSNIASAQTK